MNDKLNTDAGSRSRKVDRRPRVVLLAEQRLVGEAVRTALTSKRMQIVSVEWPQGGRPSVPLRRALAGLNPNAGLVFGDLQDPLRRAHARMLVGSVQLPWMLVVSHHDDVAWGDLVAAGATLLPSSISLEDLAKNLALLMTGAELMPQPTRARMVRDWQRVRFEDEQVTSRLNRLSPREAEVLELLASGLSVKEIGGVFQVAEGTVRSQVKAVLKKLEVNSQLAAVAILRRAPQTEARWQS